MLSHSPLPQDGEKQKLRRPMDWANEFLLGKAKSACTAKQNEELFCYFPMAAGCPARCWKAEPQQAQGLLGDTNTITTNIRFSSCHWVFVPHYDVIWSLVSWGQLSWLCPLPNSCPPPAYSLGERGRNEKALALCKPCSATVTIFTHYQHGFSYKCNMGCSEESYVCSHQSQYNHSKATLLAWGVQTADCNGAT